MAPTADVAASRVRGWDVRYVVDGMNVIGSRADGWWRDRAGARRGLVRALAALASVEEVTVVFDGRPAPGEAEEAEDSGVPVRFAPGGPNAADDIIVDVVRTDTAPASLLVVTSDAALARRVRAHGAGVLGTRAFRDRLDGFSG